MPLFTEDGRRIRGHNNQEAAVQALARAMVAGTNEGGFPSQEDWGVARVCSEYLQYCEMRRAAGAMSKSHRNNANAFLNDLCRYCGTMKVAELKTRHIEAWVEGRSGWRSQVTHRSVITVVLAAFNRAEEMFDVPNLLKGPIKPGNSMI
jgi:hypothetical protein